MPKIDIAAIPEILGTACPLPFGAPSAGRVRQRLGEAGGLGDFGVNLTRLLPGQWSSQRHWHRCPVSRQLFIKSIPTSRASHTQKAQHPVLGVQGI